MIKINNFGSNIDPCEIKNIEEKYNITLPKDYVNFIIKTDGGDPEDHIIYFKYDDGIESSACVKYFLAFVDSSQYRNIKFGLSYLHENRVPKGYFPFAYDDGGNLFCISTNSSNYGHVYFWNHEWEAEEDEEPTMNNMYYICDSFTDFINEKMDTNVPEDNEIDIENAEVWVDPDFLKSLE